MNCRLVSLLLILFCLGQAPDAEAQQVIGSSCPTVGWTTIQPNQIVYCNTNNVWALGEEITSTGYVGIGTPSPANVLQVVGSASYGVAEIVGSGTNVESSLGFRSSNVSKNGSGDWVIGTNVGGTTSGSFSFFTNGIVDPLTLLTNGNVGIGTTSPAASLDLSQKTDALALPVGSINQRPSSPVNGMLRYNSTTTPALEAYVNGAWSPLGGGSSGTSTLGTSASNTNPQRSGDPTTGIFSPAASTVAVSVGGTEAVRVTSNGNVGIGTTGLAGGLGIDQMLEVGGNVLLPYGKSLMFVNSVANYYFPVLSFGNYGGDANALVVGSPGVDQWPASIQFWVGGGVTPTEKMRITTNGNVGIGTASPVATLDVKGNQNLSGQLIFGNGSGGGVYGDSNHGVVILPGTGGNGTPEANLSIAPTSVFSGYGTAASRLSLYANQSVGATDAVGQLLMSGGPPEANVHGTSFLVGTFGAYPLALQTNNTPRLVISPSGLVGIGSSTPASSLDASQNTDALALPVGTTAQRPTAINGMLRYNSTSPPTIEGFINGAWTPILSGTGNGLNITLGTSPNATNPQAAGDVTTGLFSPASGTVAVATGGAERMRVDSSGNVGIGTSGPVRQLHIYDNGGDSSELILEHTAASTNYRKWDFVATGPNGSPSSFYIRQLTDDAIHGNIRFSIYGNGNVSIGPYDVLSPSPLTIIPSTDIPQIFIAQSNDLNSGWKLAAPTTGNFNIIRTNGLTDVSPYLSVLYSNGYVGIGTTTPQASLDINGYLRLAKNSSQPASCSSANDGAIALTHAYTLCACNGGSATWVSTSDGVASCSW